MSKSTELLLKFLEDKADSIPEYDYIQGCNILKELHLEQDMVYKMQNNLMYITNKLLSIEDRIIKIEVEIKKYKNSEELLNILYLRTESMAQCLNELGAINSGNHYIPSIDKNYHGKSEKQRAFKQLKSTRGWNF